jgi:DNA-binding response OmpR family regulator
MVRLVDRPPNYCAPAPFHPPTVSQFPARVLVVDDHADTRLMLRTILEMQNYSVLEAADGQAALDLARKEVPDIILTDWNLPIVDGMGLMRSVRSDTRIREVPIIFISGRAEPRCREAAREAGCDDYLVKPIKLDEMLIIIRRCLSSKAKGAIVLIRDRKDVV